MSIRPDRLHESDLDGFRAVAIMIVVLGHLVQRVERFHPDGEQLGSFEAMIANVLATPFTGCYLFFCLTGYSLQVFLKSRRFNEDMRFVNGYIARRVFRLAPPYFVLLIASYLFLSLTKFAPMKVNLFEVRPSSLEESLYASLLFIHYTVYATFPRLFPPGWFLETLIQFYVFAPPLFAAYNQIFFRRPSLPAGYFVLALLSIGSLMVKNFGPEQMQYSILIFAPYFWLGALLAEERRASGATGKTGGKIPSGKVSSGMGWCALAIFILLGPFSEYEAMHLAARLVCLAVMFRAATVATGSFRRVLSMPGIAPLGIACYSIYLIHLQVLHLLTPVVLALTGQPPFLAAIIICCLVELPVIMLVATACYYALERTSHGLERWLSSRLFAADPKRIG